jgi:hypothetical protein
VQPKLRPAGDLTAAAGGQKPSTREWFSDARNYYLYANDDGQYDNRRSTSSFGDRR